jgi:hypothetical protein
MKKQIPLILGIIALVYMGIIINNIYNGELGASSPCYGTRVTQGIGLCNDVPQNLCTNLAYYQVDNGVASQCYYNSDPALHICSYRPSTCTIITPTTTTTTSSTTSTTMPWNNPSNTNFITMTVLMMALVALIIFIAKEQHR